MSIVNTVCDDIAEELISRLRTLETPGEEQTTVSSVIRPQRFEDYTPEHLQIVVTQDNPEVNIELSRPGNPPATAWVQVFNLFLNIAPSKNSEESLDAIANRFVADVRKVVCTPAATWHTFDDNAIYAEWLSMEYISGDGTRGVKMPLQIIYRTDENNPYQVRM